MHASDSLSFLAAQLCLYNVLRRAVPPSGRRRRAVITLFRRTGVLEHALRASAVYDAYRPLLMPTKSSEYSSCVLLSCVCASSTHTTVVPHRET